MTLGKVILLTLLPTCLLLANPFPVQAQSTPPISPVKLHKRVLSIVVNPIIEGCENKRLIEMMKWNDPNYLNQIYIEAIREASGGIVNYEVVEKKEDLDFWPEKEDGFSYTDESYLELLAEKIEPHRPDIMNYKKFFDKLNICEIVKSKNIDEVWLWGGPWFGFFESATAGKKAINVNGAALNEIDCGKLIFIMGFSYASDVGFMLHDFSHRTEKTMIDYIFKDINIGSDYNPWDEFDGQYWRYTKESCGDPLDTENAHCGNCHHPPNSRCNEVSSTTFVWSDCDSWYYYPNWGEDYWFNPMNQTKNKKYINCTEWGCNEEGYLKWWFKHIPHAAGKTNGLYNNWWLYIADYENAINPDYRYPEPSITPSITPPPTITLKSGWNQIPGTALPKIDASTAINDINKDCGQNTASIITKSGYFLKTFIKNFGGTNSNFEANSTYFIKANKTCLWNPLAL